MGEWRRSGYGPSLRTDEFRESESRSQNSTPPGNGERMDQRLSFRSRGDNDQNATPSAARPTSIRRMPIAARCSSSRVTAITPCRSRSRRPSYKIQSKNPGITETNGSRDADTPWSSIMVGTRSLTQRSPSSSGSCDRCREHEIADRRADRNVDQLEG